MRRVLPIFVVACGSQVLSPSDGSPDVMADAASDALPDMAGEERDASLTAPSCSSGGIGAGRDCGDSGRDDCCSAPLVPGGDFKRLFDGVDFKDGSYPATVSAFRLERYEITVGRFRAFIEALRRGEGPDLGGGRHAGDPVGWRKEWRAPNVEEIIVGMKSCTGDAGAPTWTDTPSPNDRLPINCVSWIELYAFCVWDGGRLPTNLELAFASAGGGQQRYLPWSVPPTSSAVDESFAVYAAIKPAIIQFVGSRPKGVGRWGHLDLGGNVMESVVDSGPEALTLLPCVDCATPSTSIDALHYVRGGSFATGLDVMRSQDHSALVSGLSRTPYVGGRCAHSIR